MEETSYIVGRIDLAQVALYAFWVFFFGLVAWLNREGMREGYPTISEVTGKPISKAFIFPRPFGKTFLRRDGSSITVPEMPDEYELKAVPTTSFTGGPVTPTGDPLVDGVGPAAWANRPDRPDCNAAGEPRIRPMRFDDEFSIAELDADPRGFDVVCCDGEKVGKVADVWIDRAEALIRYLQVDTSAGLKLVPMTLARIKRQDSRVQVRSVTSAQFMNAPVQKADDAITLLEEDKVQAYFTGGTLYAHPSRTEPLV